MSRVLNILVEGQTEKDFVRESIYPYFLSNGISNVRTITIETSPGHKGGDVRYVARYKPNIQRLLRGQEDLIVTSLIDFYRLRNDFPGYTAAQAIINPVDKVAHIEQECAADINDLRYIPYIQLYEFEGLLFSDTKGFELFSDLKRQSKQELKNIVNTNPNPELINDGTTSAPSKRLQRLIPQYEKPLFGNMIALENGFDVIMQKCPRFNAWIEILVQRMKE